MPLKPPGVDLDPSRHYVVVLVIGKPRVVIDPTPGWGET